MEPREAAAHLRRWAQDGRTYVLGPDVLLSPEIATLAADAIENDLRQRAQAPPDAPKKSPTGLEAKRALLERMRARVVGLRREKQTDFDMAAEEMEAGADALEREIQLEEKAQPKVTLDAQMGACLHASKFWSSINHADIVALGVAAFTLRRLKEEGPARVTELETCGLSFSAGWLRSLGVEESR